MNGAQVSVIVPLYGKKDSIRICNYLEAMGRQEVAIEVIVCDNNPSPQVAHLAGKYPILHVVHQPKPGSYAARNEGDSLATAPVLAFTDADCRPVRYWMQSMLRVLEEHPNVGILGGPVILTGVDTASASALYEAVCGFRREVNIHRLHYSVTANMLARRAVFDTVGGFNDDLMSGGDLEWGRRANRAEFPILYVKDASVLHPARNSIFELIDKKRRVQGGLYRGDRRFIGQLRWLLEMLIPVRTTLRRIRCPRRLGLVRARRQGSDGRGVTCCDGTSRTRSPLRSRPSEAFTAHA